VTDSTPPKKTPAADLMDRVRWPHVVLILGLAALTVAAMVLAPDPTSAIVTGLLGGGGMVGTFLRGGVLRPAEPIPPPAPIPPRRNPRREGNALVDVLLLLASAGVVVTYAASMLWHMVGR
jgi:hypothetical protein